MCPGTLFEMRWSSGKHHTNKEDKLTDPSTNLTKATHCGVEHVEDCGMQLSSRTVPPFQGAHL